MDLLYAAAVAAATSIVPVMVVGDSYGNHHPYDDAAFNGESVCTAIRRGWSAAPFGAVIMGDTLPCSGISNAVTSASPGGVRVAVHVNSNQTDMPSSVIDFTDQGGGTYGDPDRLCYVDMTRIASWDWDSTFQYRLAFGLSPETDFPGYKDGPWYEGKQLEMRLMHRSRDSIANILRFRGWAAPKASSDGAFTGGGSAPGTQMTADTVIDADEVHTTWQIAEGSNFSSNTCPVGSFPGMSIYHVGADISGHSHDFIEWGFVDSQATAGFDFVGAVSANGINPTYLDGSAGQQAGRPFTDAMIDDILSLKKFPKIIIVSFMDDGGEGSSANIAAYKTKCATLVARWNAGYTRAGRDLPVIWWIGPHGGTANPEPDDNFGRQDEVLHELATETANMCYSSMYRRRDLVAGLGATNVHLDSQAVADAWWAILQADMESGRPTSSSKPFRGRDFRRPGRRRAA
ncbi:MAG: hypothetical protein AAF432_00345 [Planctomycetota bacterium]